MTLQAVGLTFLLTAVVLVHCQDNQKFTISANNHQCDAISSGESSKGKGEYVQSQSLYPFISYQGDILPNNSYLNLSNIQTHAIGCHTDLRTCCNGNFGSARGDWYFPNQTQVQFKARNSQTYEMRKFQHVDLYHSGNEIGVFCCGIETNAVHGCGQRDTVCVDI